jgi:hypothetical protein
VSFCEPFSHTELETASVSCQTDIEDVDGRWESSAGASDSASLVTSMVTGVVVFSRPKRSMTIHQ